MTDDNIDLSRRKVLGALGTVGVASAGAGVGTSAFFSDTESYENNQLTAGELDLKVDWEEHYSDWSDDEADAVSDIVMTDGDPGNVPGEYVGLPDPRAPMIALPEDDVSAFQDATAVEAYPDTNDDGIQDPFGETTNGTQVEDFCTDGADDPSDLDPAGSLRSNNDDTVDSDGNAKPIVSLDDVKPGDFGEVTFSFHLCNNSGYVWMNGELVNASENGVTEPEADSDGETDGTVELLDELRTTLWYDDGDNVLERSGEGTGGAADVVIVADGSGSVTSDSDKFQSLQDGAEALVNAVGSDVNVGFVPFSDSATVEASLTDDKSTTISEIQDDSNYPGGGTDIGTGITTGQNHLTSSAGRPDADKILVVLTNGKSSTGRSEATSAKDAGTTIYGIAYGDGADEGLIEDISSPPKSDDGSIDDQDEFAFLADQTDIGQVFGDIGGRITAGEEVFFRGTLREALDVLGQGNGIPLDGDRNSDYDEVVDDGSGGQQPNAGDADARNCYTPEMSHYVGLTWYVPTAVGNRIQSDSVKFDLGFYTEQCRHNDGSGQASG